MKRSSLVPAALAIKQLSSWKLQRFQQGLTLIELLVASATGLLLVDLQEAAADKMRTVAYGTFTGRVFPIGQGSLPSQLPRYLMEFCLIALQVCQQTAPSRASSIGLQRLGLACVPRLR